MTIARRFTSLALSLALAASTLRTQEPETADPWSLIPGNAVFVAWCDGPAKLREAFESTRLGRALGGPELSSKMAPVLEALREQLADTGLDAETAEKTFLEYGGRMLVAVGLDFEKLLAASFEGAASPMSEADLWISIVLAADGHTDFEQLLRMTEERRAAKALERGVEIVDLRVAGKVVRAERRKDQELAGTLPFTWGGNLVMIGGADLERTVEKCLLPTGKTLADRPIARAAGNAGMWVELQSVLSALFARLEEATPDPDAAAAALDATGFRALDTISAVVEPAGEHVRLAVRGSLTEDASGLLKSFLVVSVEPPRTLDLVPVQRENWSVARWDPKAMYAAFGEIADAVSELSGKTRVELEDAFAEFMHVRLGEDLIAHLGGETLTVNDGAPPTFDDLDNEEELPGGTCLGVTLDDPHAFGESLEKMIRSRGLHVSRKSEDYRGFSIHRLAFGKLQIHYTVSERALLIGIGASGAQQVRAVLDEERDRAEGKPRAPLPAAIKERLEHAASGWNGLGAGSVTLALETYRGVFHAIAAQPAAYGVRRGSDATVLFKQIAAHIDEVVETARELVTRYRLETWVVVTKSERRAFEAQMIW